MPGINTISHLIHQKTKSFELYHPHSFYSTIILLYFHNSLYFYYDNFRRDRHGNVNDNVKVFGLDTAAAAAEQVQRLATANTQHAAVSM